MRLFFHHVGKKGADEDFKKTVYRDISIETVECNVPVSYPHRDERLRACANRRVACVSRGSQKAVQSL